MELPQRLGDVFGVVHAGVFPYGEHPLRYLNKLLLTVWGKMKLGETGQEFLKQLEAGDTDTLAGVDRCIMENPAWREWSERFLATGKGFPFLPRVIGIGPPLTSGLKQVLVNMVMEVLNADHSRNYPN